MKDKKLILLTGATGVMGSAGLRELMARRDRFDIRLLVRPREKNLKKLKNLATEPGVEIVWGDMTSPADVLRAVGGTDGISPADYVLHVGGMVSPKADRLPKTTLKVNVSAAENIVKAVLAQPNSDEIKVVYIGSVAQVSDRNPPMHWGRTGDPVCISVYDHYAISKTIAERIFVESGIKNWVCLRQSGILHPGVLNNFDPIMFHVPLRGVLEWTTIEDSGRLLARVCEDDVPSEFWNRFYNIGSGSTYRITNYEFMRRLLETISCPPPERIFEARWFALRNFHGMWYLDSDELERLLHFRENIPLDDYFRRRMHPSVPRYFRLAKLAPAPFIKWIMRRLAHKKEVGTMDWIRTRNSERIASYFGTYKAWENIPDWPQQQLSPPTTEPRHIDHGYDETKSLGELDRDDMCRAAKFRGGKCLSDTMMIGDMATPLVWECQFGHRFSASPALVLQGGHWCPECLPPPWNYDVIATGNPFFAQVWHPQHGTGEHNFYDEGIYADWEW
jgi:nucleoside-diphosphate-sugar epimerase